MARVVRTAELQSGPMRQKTLNDRFTEDYRPTGKQLAVAQMQHAQPMRVQHTIQRQQVVREQLQTTRRQARAVAPQPFMAAPIQYYQAPPPIIVRQRQPRVQVQYVQQVQQVPVIRRRPVQMVAATGSLVRGGRVARAGARGGARSGMRMTRVAAAVAETERGARGRGRGRGARGGARGGRVEGAAVKPSKEALDADLDGYFGPAAAKDRLNSELDDYFSSTAPAVAAQ